MPSVVLLLSHQSTVQAMIWLGTEIKIPAIMNEGPWNHWLFAFNLSEVDIVTSFVWKLCVLSYIPTKPGMLLNCDILWNLLFYLSLLYAFISHLPSISVWLAKTHTFQCSFCIRISIKKKIPLHLMAPSKYFPCSCFHLFCLHFCIPRCLRFVKSVCVPL